MQISSELNIDLVITQPRIVDVSEIAEVKAWPIKHCHMQVLYSLSETSEYIADTNVGLCLLHKELNYTMSFRFETYLMTIRCMTKLRSSSHDLKLQSGRHKKPKCPVLQRICQMCNSNHIECEKHFILLCARYQEHRIKLFVNIMKIDSQLLEQVGILFMTT